MSVVIMIDEADFRRLPNSHESLTRHGDVSRFRYLHGKLWHRICWFGADYTAVILARAFLLASGIEFSIGRGELKGWCIVTDYDYSAPPSGDGRDND